MNYLIDWNVEPGATIRRSTLHDIYGGGRQGGMEPCAKSTNVLLFTSPATALEFGYDFDGWHSDGTFHYTGEGQIGDQVMTYGNRAARDHLKQARAIRLFEKNGTDVIYIGRFEIPDESHVLLDEAPDRDKFLRSVFIFRLRPVGETWRDPVSVAPPETITITLPIEAMNITEYVRQREKSEPTTALRSEAELVLRFNTWLKREGTLTTERQAIPTAGGHLMYTDLYIKESRELIEAKSSSSREHVRGALGQILDYARYVEHSRLAVLTPSRPSDEMISLLIAHGVGCIWETDNGKHFERSEVANAWS